MSSLLSELHYLPPVSFFTLLAGADELVLEVHENYVKQSYRNRCYINGANGVDRLIVPITSNHKKTLIKEVKIDYQQKWLNRHWRAIYSAYGKAPFFEYYAQDLEQILVKKPTYLFELNYELLTMCLKWLRWDVAIYETQTYQNGAKMTQNDCRNMLDGKNRGKFDQAVNLQPYYQVFGNVFVPDLSIIDLIFCCGPEATDVIFRSKTNE